MKAIEKLQKLLNIFNIKEDIKSDIIKFFKENPNPNDDQVHIFAKEKGIEPDDLETYIYSLVTDLLNKSENYIKVIGNLIPDTTKDRLLPIGKHNDIPYIAIDPKELAIGAEIEMEHTDDINIAKAIARDHIAEIQDYYTNPDYGLIAMEKKAKSKAKTKGEINYD